ncbi:TetR/AcrR family transcriptional regulator [Mycobacterium sp. UM_CSW]|uniref:TetR/AcrR family transcriptional regulator n=1 Tax=Mycobacterium sp. UM_CSW TaxID=1370119 RepID=UPI000415A958|nr:TetR/AcrR family transcriptional regulator [Mycobacterium sp. UM_CSW]
MRRDAETNRSRLIAAAEEVFAQHGARATLEDVARAAGTGPATLYRRFPNKDALVREVLSEFFRRLLATAEEAHAAPDERCLSVFLYTVGAELVRKSGLSAYLWGDLAPKPLVEELRQQSAALLSRGQRSGAIRQDVTSADVTATIWALRGICAAGGADDLWRRHLDTVLRGLRPSVEEHSQTGCAQ